MTTPGQPSAAFDLFLFVCQVFIIALSSAAGMLAGHWFNGKLAKWRYRREFRRREKRMNARMAEALQAVADLQRSPVERWEVIMPLLNQGLAGPGWVSPGQQAPEPPTIPDQE